MQKSTMFCNPNEIAKTLNEILDEMNSTFDSDISYESDFAFKLAYYYYELIYVHPFREGNGRTIRAFLRDFVLSKSEHLTCGPLDLDYTKMNAENLMLGTVRRHIYPSMLEMEFMKGLVKADNSTKENRPTKK